MKKPKLRPLKHTPEDRSILLDAIRRAPHFQADSFARMCIEGHINFVTNGTVAVAIIDHPERLEK